MTSLSRIENPTGFVHLAHAAHTNLRSDFVETQASAGLQRHDLLVGEEAREPWCLFPSHSLFLPISVYSP